MKQYEVTVYLHTNCTVIVEADNENDAVDVAFQKLDDGENIEQCMAGFVSDGAPDVFEL